LYVGMIMDRSFIYNDMGAKYISVILITRFQYAYGRKI